MEFFEVICFYCALSSGICQISFAQCKFLIILKVFFFKESKSKENILRGSGFCLLEKETEIMSRKLYSTDTWHINTIYLAILQGICLCWQPSAQ